jgi:hypothetical protein
MRVWIFGVVGLSLSLGACKDTSSHSTGGQSGPAPTAAAAPAEAEARLLGTWVIDLPAWRALPIIQKKSEEERQKAEAKSKLLSYSFHADHTVDVTGSGLQPQQRGTWHVSKSRDGELNLQILTGDGKGNDNFEATLEFPGSDRMRMILPVVGPMPLMKK